jgi:hypothetical protein
MKDPTIPGEAPIAAVEETSNEAQSILRIRCSNEDTKATISFEGIFY